MTTKVVSKRTMTWTDKVRMHANDKYWFRLSGEFLSSFFFVFIINVVIALGEDEIPFFHFFYEYNIGMGLWIGFMTMVAFVWSQKTTLAANTINLALAHRRKEINNGTFWSSVPIQFAGGVIGALFVYFIAASFIKDTDSTLHAMGGAYPKLKGLVNNNVAVGNTSFINPWASINFVDKYADTHREFVYFYAIIQGFINGSWIVIAFILNTIVDDKANNRTKQLLLRYIILIVGITITTMFTANTTNWVRLLTPTIVNVLMQNENALLVMDTTLVYIAVQFIGLMIVYFELVWKDIVAEQHRQEEMKLEEENN